MASPPDRSAGGTGNPTARPAARSFSPQRPAHRQGLSRTGLGGSPGSLVLGGLLKHRPTTPSLTFPLRTP